MMEVSRIATSKYVHLSVTLSPIMQYVCHLHYVI